MVLLASFVLALVTAADTDPESVAFRTINTLFSSQYVENFLNYNKEWYYGSALINIGLFEVLQTFTDNATESTTIYNTATKYMNLYYNPGGEAYNVTNNITMPFDSTPGDHLGLYPVSYLMRYQYDTTKNQTDLFVAEQVAKQYLLGYPTRLPEGTMSRDEGWDDEPDYHGSFLWCDDMYMGLTLLARLSVQLKYDTYIDFVATQKLGFAQHLQDTDGVFFHGYNNNDTKDSCCKWGRANGWTTMSHVEALLAFKSFPQHPLQPMILKIFTTHMTGIAKYQDASGLWHQVLDNTTIWLETSGSAMFLYSMAQGIMNGWLSDSEYGPIADKAWIGVANTVQADGTVTGICEGCGIQTDVQGYADKSTAYSSSGPALGSVLRAAVAYEQLTRWRKSFYV